MIRIPLLCDRHTHPLLYAAFLEGLSLQNPAETRDSVLERIRTQARSQQNELTLAYGWNSGHYTLTKADFDDLPPVVVLNLSLHGLLVNEAGREYLKQFDAEVVAHLDDEDWIERNLRRGLSVFASGGASAARLQRFYDWLLHEHGVYHAEEMLLATANEIRFFEEAKLLHRTRFWAAPDLYEELPLQQREIVHGIKLFTDGALGVRTAALQQPYRDSPQRGLLLYDNDELEALLRRYLSQGKPMAIHAIGDRAIDQVVAVVEKVSPPSTSEIRMEHAQLISQATAKRAKALGIHLCMQPNFSDDSVYYADRLPTGYPERNNPFRMLIDDAGYVVGEDLFFGSDGMPHGIHEGLRQSLYPDPRYQQQPLTLAEFIAGYCMPNEEHGHIEVEIDAANRAVQCRIFPSPT